MGSSRIASFEKSQPAAAGRVTSIINSRGRGSSGHRRVRGKAEHKGKGRRLSPGFSGVCPRHAGRGGHRAARLSRHFPGWRGNGTGCAPAPLVAQHHGADLLPISRRARHRRAGLTRWPRHRHPATTAPTLGHQLAGDVAEVEIDGAGQAGFCRAPPVPAGCDRPRAQAAADKGQITPPPASAAARPWYHPGGSCRLADRTARRAPHATVGAHSSATRSKRSGWRGTQDQQGGGMGLEHPIEGGQHLLVLSWWVLAAIQTGRPLPAAGAGRPGLHLVAKLDVRT